MCEVHDVRNVRCPAVRHAAVRHAAVRHAVQQPQRLRQNQAQRQQGGEPRCLMQLAQLHALNFKL